MQGIFISDRIKIITYCFILPNKGDAPMKESNLKLAQQDIDAALETVDDIEKFISGDDLEKEKLKEKFVALSQKVQQLENLLKNEGIL